MKHSEHTELQEFQEFLNTASALPSDAMTQTILSDAVAAQTRFKGVVFAKLVAIHSVMSVLSLSVCHQFDMNPFNTSISLSDYFMEYGHSYCMLFCGFLFIGGSLLAARVLLRSYEFAVIRISFPLQFFALCSLSLGVFMAFGAHLTLGFGLLWIVGALIGSALPTYLFPAKFAHAS